MILVFDVPTIEQGVSDFSTRGVPDGILDRAASPRSGADATYRSYWYSHNVTRFVSATVAIPNLDRARGFLQSFNLGSLFDRPTGGDTIQIDGLRVIKITSIGP